MSIVIIPQRLPILQLLVAQVAAQELIRRVRVFDVNGNFLLNDCVTNFTSPFIVAELFAVFVEVFYEIESGFALQRAYRASINSWNIPSSSHAHMMIESILCQEFQAALIAMEMVRCSVYSDPIIKTTGMSFLVVFHHLRLEREELFTKRTNDCEVNRPTSV